jgi:hypothetical protein
MVAMWLHSTLHFNYLQVAAFCGTSMAAELLLAGQLPIGSSQQQSELLLQQTQEAADAQLEVTGVGNMQQQVELINSTVLKCTLRISKTVFCAHQQL